MMDQIFDLPEKSKFILPINNLLTLTERKTMCVKNTTRQ